MIAIIVIIVGLSHLTTPFITVLFSVLLLNLLDRVFNRKWLSVVAFGVFVVAILVILFVFSQNSLRTLPHVASTSIPLILDYFRAKGWEFLIPFEDAESLKVIAIDTMKSELVNFAKYFNVMTREFISLIIGLVVAASLFLNSELDLDKERHPAKNNAYSALSIALSQRFDTFYQCFARVMGAQLLISTINTFFTGLYVFIVGVPHGSIVVVLTFLCGLLPIVGNLISNTIIFCISLTISVQMAVSSLIFLIVLHKLEYFLNSKIIGARIRNPMWLTLLGLVVGERLLGIPGMILAPVILNYIKVEAGAVEID